MNRFAISADRREMPLSDPPLIAAVREPNPGRALASFDSVVLPYLDDAYTLAYWLTGNRTDAEDVVQDACLRAFRALESFSNGNARGWVLAIVRHTAFNWMRKNRPARIVAMEDIEIAETVQPMEMDIETPEATLIAKNEVRLIDTAIAALPSALRETLVLRDVQDLSYREIADVTCVPIGTVMSRLARARTKLRELLSV